RVALRPALGLAAADRRAPERAADAEPGRLGVDRLQEDVGRPDLAGERARAEALVLRGDEDVRHLGETGREELRDELEPAVLRDREPDDERVEALAREPGDGLVDGEGRPRLVPLGR